MREIRTLRAMWRALETELRQLLNGHEEGNLGYKPRRNLRATAPALDPTVSARARRKDSPWIRRPSEDLSLSSLRETQFQAEAGMRRLLIQFQRATVLKSDRS